MTRKRWRKLMMAEAAYRRGNGIILDMGRFLDNLRHAKMERGYDGNLYWSTTNNPAAVDSYAEHMEVLRGCRR